MKADNRRVAHLAPGEGQSLRVFGDLKTFKARDEAYTLLECRALPGVGGLPPHFHRDQDVAIYVLEGEYTLVVGGERELNLCSGSFVNVPRGMVHTLRATGRDLARCLVILSPSGPLERFFEDVGSRDGYGVRPDAREVLASARRHGISLLTQPV